MKRVLGLAGSVVLGVTGALAFASAAQAHHTEFDHRTECADDGWTVTWEAWDWTDNPSIGPGEIIAVSTDPAGPLGDEFVVGNTLPLLSSGERLSATQHFGADVPSVEISITVKWSNNVQRTNTRIASAPTDCEPEKEPTPEPSAWGVSDCFGLTVYYANNNPDVPAEFTFAASNDDEVYSDTPENADVQSWYFPAWSEDEGLSVVVSVNGEEFAVFDWEPANCEWGEYYETCDGLEFELAIPEDGVATSFTFVPSNGDEVTFTLEPGESRDVNFDANGAEEFEVYFLIEDEYGAYDGEIPWTKPEDCDEVPAPTTPAEEKGLPVTGSSLTIMLSSAAALALGAIVLFLIARRRKMAANW